MTEHERDNWEHELMLEGNAGYFDSIGYPLQSSISIDSEGHRDWFQQKCIERAFELLAVITSREFDCGIADAEKMTELVSETLVIARSYDSASSMETDREVTLQELDARETAND